MPNHYEPEDHEMLNWYAQGINKHDASIKYIFKRGLPGPWVKPVLLSGWFNPGGLEDKYQYRMFTPELMQHKGTLDGGSSGSVAYILLRPLWPPYDLHFTGNVLASGVLFARFDVSSVTGEVKVNF